MLLDLFIYSVMKMAAAMNEGKASNGLMMQMVKKSESIFN